MFEKAFRLKLRFNTPKGLLTIEDLWDLPLTSNTGKACLDDLARKLHTLNNTTVPSFVTKASAVDEIEKLKFDIVVHIINVRLAEAQTATDARINRERKQQLMSLIEQKQNEQLSALSIDELRKMVEVL